MSLSPETQTPYRIAMVCLGNICRSPIAEVVLSAKIAAAGLADDVVVDSSGTGGWHLGDPIDSRAAEVLVSHGYDPTRHRARQFVVDWFDEYDIVLTMDRSNLGELERLSRGEADLDKIRMFRSFDPLSTGDLDVPDPWYGGQADFEHVLTIVERTTHALILELSGSS
ncbi:MAG: low molecular weight phosphotyrosine protein phosphatase [Actinomycetota bacterium]|jgi:protein-tyrosine phosphatase|nr:low molecular weight phosphotyrosine protein phosphatase [Actinomycetota bacterium]